MRPVLAGKCSLRDLQEHHDIDSLMDLHELLDLELALHELARKNSERRDRP